MADNTNLVDFLSILY